jgi:hypothetical protein
MKVFLFTILTTFLVTKSSGQVTFSNIDSKFKTTKGNGSTQLICSTATMLVKFSLKRPLILAQQNNFATIDSQIIQIIPLKFKDYKKVVRKLNMDDQKQLLGIYSNYELEYFKNELKIEVVNPNHQWVITKSKGWFIWYFRIGNLPVQVDKPTEIQLFASTVVGDKVLTINAPIKSDTDFNKAAQIVNEMMETLIILKS